MERQIVENMTTTSGSTSSHLSWEQERQASLSDAPAIPGRRPDATPNHSYCSAARPSNRLPIHMLALRKAKRKTKSHSSPSSRPITEMDVHPAVLFLSGTFSIATSIIVGPSLFPCQRDRRTMALDLLEQAIGIDLCALFSKSASRSPPISSPTIVLIVVQMYALSTVAFHQCRPRDRWRNAIVVAVVILGAMLNCPPTMGIVEILEHMAVNLPQLLSLGLLLSVIGHSWAQMQQCMAHNLDGDGLRLDHSTFPNEKLSAMPEKDLSV